MYSSKITRQHRTAFVILCDHSGSMAEECSFGGEIMSKAEAEALIINMMLEELINRCRREYGIRNYFDLAVISYSGKGVRPLLSEKMEFISVDGLTEKDVAIRKRHIIRTLPGGEKVSAIIGHRWWINGEATGNTPMSAAFATAEELTVRWCLKASNADSFPPIVINITDGEATDAGEEKLLEMATRIKSLSTRDGNLLLFNIHLAGNERGAGISFPGKDENLPTLPYARLLWEMSSQLPSCYDRLILSGRPGSSPPFRAMGYNCTMEELYGMLAIGTVSSSFVI